MSSTCRRDTCSICGVRDQSTHEGRVERGGPGDKTPCGEMGGAQFLVVDVLTFGRMLTFGKPSRSLGLTEMMLIVVSLDLDPDEGTA